MPLRDAYQQLRDDYLQLRDAFFFNCDSKFPMKLTYQQLRVAFIFVYLVCVMFNSLESISPVDNMPAPGWGVYVSSGSFQWMGRWRLYQEEDKELLSVIDHLNGSTAAHSGRKTTGETSDVIGIWIEITWAKAVVICLLLSVNLLFSSQITWAEIHGSSQITRAELHGSGQITRAQIRGGWGREIGLEDLQGQFGRTREDAAAQLGVSVSTFKRRCRKNGIKQWSVSLRSGGSDPIQEYFDGEINWGTENDSIAETSETPTIAPVIDQPAMSTVYRNSNPLLSVQPQVPLTQMASDNLGIPLLSVQAQVTQMASENLGSPLVSVQPQVPLTQMPSENLGSSDDGRTYLAQQDTRVVMIKAMYGKDTKLLFPFPVASGIIGLKGEVSKRLKFELDSFDIKYEDHVGDLILIACDEDLIFYLNVFKPLDDLVFKLVVIPRPRTEVNVADH